MRGKCFRLVLLVLLGAPSAAFALPWDVDLYRQPSLKSNEIARAPVKGTIPVGAKPFQLSNDEAEKVLKNPTPVSFNSVWRGKRLFEANCLTCHGPTGAGNGPVGPLMAAPDLLTEYYKTQRGDGRIFGVITNGGSNMPRYGYKFSEADRWDLVNYVRFLQGTEIPGMDRPK